MQIVEEIHSSKLFADFITSAKRRFSELVNLLITIAEIPAPTFKEKNRAEFVKTYLQRIGLSDIRTDRQSNVVGVFSGRDRTKRIVFFAHLDTVFPLETELKVKSSGNILSCPGIGDNSASIATALTILDIWKKIKYVPPTDIVFVADTCEEGLGDLMGIRTFLDDLQEKGTYKAYIAVDGQINQLINQGIGVRRLEVSVRTHGGHSWSDFGKPSAIHILGRMINEITNLGVPTTPRTTFNIGMIQGGTSINTIAQNASMLVDLRSLDQAVLKDLETRVRKAITRMASTTDIKVEITIVGDRPAGKLSENHSIISIAKHSAQKFAITLEIDAASTDANIPLSLGLPAITIGVYRGNGAHTREESLDIESMKAGITYLSLFLMSASQWAAIN